MKLSYDFHIHSALSPCADNEMTPCNIVAMATINGLNAIAITDHNAIANVEAAMELGEAYGVTVVPGVEVQTNEDIHVLALFETYEKLKAFFEKLEFPDMKNDEEVFGLQLIVNSDDEVVGKEKRLLLTSANIGIYELCPLIAECGGVAIPAHIDREANGILAILGDVPEDLPIAAIEFSPYADENLRQKYARYKQITDSDSHRFDTLLHGDNYLETDAEGIKGIFGFLRGSRN